MYEYAVHEYAVYEHIMYGYVVYEYVVDDQVVYDCVVYEYMVYEYAVDDQVVCTSMLMLLTCAMVVAPFACLVLVWSMGVSPDSLTTTEILPAGTHCTHFTRNEVISLNP